MAQASALRWLFPAMVVGLTLWWWLQSRSPEPEPAVIPVLEQVAPASAPATVMRSPAGESARRVIPGGFDLPPADSATPAEIESLREAEVERSAASPLPPRSFTGPDGKPREFAYGGAEERAREQAQADRRSLLMARLRADPRAFGREHRLSAKEVQWILDGSTDFPDRLLD